MYGASCADQSMPENILNMLRYPTTFRINRKAPFIWKICYKLKNAFQQKILKHCINSTDQDKNADERQIMREILS